jgi:hypothetical protein
MGMPTDKKQLVKAGKSVTTPMGGAKTVSSMNVFQHGIVTCLEINYSDSTTYYFKVNNQGVVEAGGTLELGTGTAVSW